MTPDIREKAEKITQSEIVELFGDEMPIEAANLLFNAPDYMTIGEVREKIRALAKEWNTPDRRYHAQAERLQREMLHNTSGLTERDLISQALLEAHNAGRAEMREEAAGWLEVRCMQAISSYNAIVNGGDQSTAATYHAEGHALAEAATAIRSIK